MSRLVSLLLSFALLFAPLLAYADDGAAPAPEPEPELAAPARVDDLGRPFPDPLLLRRSRTWTGLGAGMTGLGSAMVVTGLFVGSAFARGEIVPPRLELAGPLGDRLGDNAGAIIPVVVLLGGGLLLDVVGVPLLSAGMFMNKQLRRTIKGAEKVPRTVANEERYWNAYASRMFAQAMMITGGGQAILGVLTLVAIAALIGTENYDPWMWLAVGGEFVAGAAFIVGGLLLARDADQKMEGVRDEVDPMRQQQALLQLVPVPAFATVPRDGGPDEVRGSLTWSFAF